MPRNAKVALIISFFLFTEVWQASSAESESETIMRFPESKTFARLYLVRLVGEGEKVNRSDHSKGILAIGAVSAKNGQMYSLAVNDSGASQPQFLDSLANAPIVEINLRSVESCTDSTVQHACRISALRQLILIETEVSDKAIEYCCALTNLHQLALNETRVEGSNLGNLGRIPDLRALELNRLDLRKSKLQGIQKLGHLEILSINHSRVDDMACANIGHVQTLRELDLSNNPVTDSGLAKLANLRKLQGLNLAQTKITAKGALSTLPKLPSLQTLKIWDGQLTSEELALIKHALPKCKVEVVNRANRLNPELFKSLR
jgi:hypothetical protein